MPTRHFCAYFDANYLPRGLALYRSLQRHARPFHLHVLCLDPETLAALQPLQGPDLSLAPLASLEAADPDLLRVKPGRSRLEYYYTLTASCVRFFQDRCPGADPLTYLDADLFFYSDPTPALDELRDRSVLIMPHRYPQRLSRLNLYGLYNVSFLVFRRDAAARACLDRWREQCIEWCFNRVEGDRFGDQKYLDDWPARFPKVGVIEHPGAGLAPWNVEPERLRLSRGQIMVNGAPLICFHFHALQVFSRHVFDPGFHRFGIAPAPTLLRRVYAPYLRELGLAMKTAPAGQRQSLADWLDLASYRRPLVSVGHAAVELNLARLVCPLRAAAVRAATLLRRPTPEA